MGRTALARIARRRSRLAGIAAAGLRRVGSCLRRISWAGIAARGRGRLAGIAARWRNCLAGIAAVAELLGRDCRAVAELLGRAGAGWLLPAEEYLGRDYHAVALLALDFSPAVGPLGRDCRRVETGWLLPVEEYLGRDFSPAVGPLGRDCRRVETGWLLPVEEYLGRDYHAVALLALDFSPAVGPLDPDCRDDFDRAEQPKVDWALAPGVSDPAARNRTPAGFADRLGAGFDPVRDPEAAFRPVDGY